MATEAAWLKRQRTHVSKNKNVLTRTGLLMEGVDDSVAEYDWALFFVAAAGSIVPRP